MNGAWVKFKSIRRGYIGLWVLTIILGVSFLAPFLANDRPLLAWYDGRLFVPVFRIYPETKFGGQLDSEADYKDPVVMGLIQQKGWMMMPPLPYRFSTIDSMPDTMHPMPPSRQHWMGTDDVGRDVVSRLLWGTRISMFFAIALTAISALVGTLLGAIQGYLGGWTDLSLQRFIEVWSGLPVLFILIILSTLFTPGFWTLLGLMTLFQWTALVGLVRTEVYRVRNMEYVQAARAMGVSTRWIILRHVIPNSLTSALTYLPFQVCAALTALTALDFLGLGLPPGSASLGEMLSQGRNNLDAPWLALSAFGVLAALQVLLIFVGEAVRAAFDPRQQLYKLQD